MAQVAKARNLQRNFEMADILQFKYADQSFGSAIAFYAIVHFDYEQMKVAFEETKRVLIDGGKFLLSFHIGGMVVHRDEFFGRSVNIGFFETTKIALLLTEVGFKIIDAIEREP